MSRKAYEEPNLAFREQLPRKSGQFLRTLYIVLSHIEELTASAVTELKDMEGLKFSIEPVVICDRIVSGDGFCVLLCQACKNIQISDAYGMRSNRKDSRN